MISPVLTTKLRRHPIKVLFIYLFLLYKGTDLWEEVESIGRTNHARYDPLSHTARVRLRTGGYLFGELWVRTNPIQSSLIETIPSCREYNNIEKFLGGSWRTLSIVFRYPESNSET